MNRTRAALLLIAFSLCCAAVLVVLSLRVLADPRPEERTGGAGLRVSLPVTHTLFPGDCLVMSWTVDDAQRVFVNDGTAGLSGQWLLCDGTDPRIRIERSPTEEWRWTFAHTTLFGEVPGQGMLVLGLAAGLAGLALLGAGHWRMWSRPAAQWGAVLGFAVAFTIVLDLFTNQLNTVRFTWDFVHYIDMAENGVLGNPGLIAPYAYRPLPSMLAGLLSDALGRSTYTGFRMLAYAGLIGQLVLAFVLARLFITRPGRRFWGAFAVMLLTAGAGYSARFYLFDVFRPDPLAFPLILLGMIGLVQGERCRAAGAGAGRWAALVIGSSMIGVLMREFALLPAALLIAALLRQAWRTRRAGPLLQAGLAALLTGAALAAPRLLLSIARSDQLLDHMALGDVLTLWPRNLNVVLGLALPFLPVVILLAAGSARAGLAALRGMRLLLALYFAGVAVLTIVGGTDISRFTAYLVIPVIIISAALIDAGARALLVLFAVLAQLAFYRALAVVPMWSLDAYLDYYIVYWDRQSGETWLRVGEWALWAGGGLVLGWASAARERTRARAADAG
jgi:hypothetical protein